MDAARPAVLLDVEGLQALIDALTARGYAVIGPTLRGGVVVHEEIRSVAQLPRGARSEQDAAHYRLTRSGGEDFFAFAAAGQSWKPFLLPARRSTWRASRGDAAEARTEAERPPADRPLALLGVRSCDLHAIGVHDRVLTERTFVDPDYQSRRARVFIVAVACTHPAGTCFCASMGTGPRPDKGFDISLVELSGDGRHHFVAEPGSPRGADVLAGLKPPAADSNDIADADAVCGGAAQRMGRAMDTTGIRDLLYDKAEDPRWDDVAERCLTCGNCTLVCPTCFCTTTEDVTDLTGERAERWSVWDSCFTLDFSHLHGGSVRASARSRYRHWMTHKLASWADQFGTSGCVGCGRCITWCPAAIDITEELAAIRAQARADEEDGHAHDS